MKFFQIFLVLFGILFSMLAFAGSAQGNIDAILPSNAHVGIIIRSLDKDETIYSHNDNLLFMPGSTLKIITAIAALKHLGPTFTYSTQLLVNSDEDRCGPNNFYLKFSGDPTLTAKDLAGLFAVLRQAEIYGSSGNIYYNIADYNVPRANKAWMLSDIETCEVGPISRAIIDENYYHFEICPATDLLKPSILRSKLEIYPKYKIDNQVITGLDKDYIWRSYGFLSDSLRILGITGINLKPQRIELPVDDLDYYVQQHIILALKENGIESGYQIATGEIPKNAVVIAEHKSQNLSDILSEGLRYSLNLPFAVLPIELATCKNPLANTWRDVSNTIVKLLEDDYAIDLSQALIDDGIGLSRYSLISPKQLSDVLVAAYGDKDISSYFVNGLAQNGKTGDLINRLNDSDLVGRINAKTGGMTGVSGLAGYLKTKKGNQLSFVIFVNGFSGGSKPFRDFQDDVCRILIEQY